MKKKRDEKFYPLGSNTQIVHPVSTFALWALLFCVKTQADRVLHSHETCLDGLNSLWVSSLIFRSPFDFSDLGTSRLHSIYHFRIRFRCLKAIFMSPPGKGYIIWKPWPELGVHLPQARAGPRSVGDGLFGRGNFFGLAVTNAVVPSWK